MRITRGDSPSRGMEAAQHPRSARALGVGSPGAALPFPSPPITVSSRVPASPPSSGRSQAGEAGGQHSGGQGLPFSCLVLGRAGGACPLPGKPAGLCRACEAWGLLGLCRVGVPAEGREMCLGSHKPCCGAGALFATLEERLGQGSSRALLSFRALISLGSDPALLCLAGHTSRPPSLPLAHLGRVWGLQEPGGDGASPEAAPGSASCLARSDFWE